MGMFEGIDTGVLAAVGVLVVVQVTLQVIALVQLVKSPSERVTLGGRKWLWAVIIVIGEIVGPIIWFVIGRTPAPADVAPYSGDGGERSSAVDTLYGKTDE